MDREAELINDALNKRIEQLEATIKRVRDELSCISHHEDCASEIGKPCDCALADVYKAAAGAE